MILRALWLLALSFTASLALASGRLQIPDWQVFDANGDVGDGWKVYFYDSGTSTPRDTYSDSALTTPNANPVVADSAGRLGDVFVSGTYKIVLNDENDVTQVTYDPVVGQGVINGVSISDIQALDGAADQCVYASYHTTLGDRGGGMFCYDAASTCTDDGAICLDPPAAGAGRWIRQYTGCVQAEWFGLVPDDDTADNSTAINNALLSVGRGCVEISGLYDDEITYYYIQAPIEVPDAVVFRGDNQRAVRIFVSGSTWSGTTVTEAPAVSGNFTYATRLGDGDHAASPFVIDTRIEGIHVDASLQSDVVACYSTQINESSGWRDVQCTSKDREGIRVSAEDRGKTGTVGSPKNFDIERVTAVTYDPPAVNNLSAMHISSSHWRTMQGLTVIGNGFQGVTADSTENCLYFRFQSQGRASGIHVEGCENGVRLGGDQTTDAGNYAAGTQVSNVIGTSTLSGDITNCVLIGSGVGTNMINLEGIQKRDCDYAVKDDQSGGVLYDDLWLGYWRLGAGAIGDREIFTNSASLTGTLPNQSYLKDTKFLDSVSFKSITRAADYTILPTDPGWLILNGTVSLTITLADATLVDGKLQCITGAGAATTHTIQVDPSTSNFMFEGTTPLSVTLPAYTTWCWLAVNRVAGQWHRIAP